VTDPATGWRFDYGVNKPHGYAPYTTPQFVTIMAQYMADQALLGVSTPWLGAAKAPAGHAKAVSQAAALSRER
jgi:hypothetical protein